jgi:hypothetical protein
MEGTSPTILNAIPKTFTGAMLVAVCGQLEASDIGLTSNGVNSLRNSCLYPNLAGIASSVVCSEYELGLSEIIRTVTSELREEDGLRAQASNKR